MLKRVLSTRAITDASARRPWTIIGVWVLAFLLAGFLINTLLDGVLTTKFDFTSNPDSKVGDELLQERLRGPTSTNEVVIVRSDSLTVDDDAFRDTVEEIHGKVQALGPEFIRPETLTNYYQSGAPLLVSQDRHVTIIPFTMAGDFDDASDNIDKVYNTVHEVQPHQGLEVLMTGQATVGRDFREIAESDLQTGEAFGIPIAVIILALVLGALVATFVPLIQAGVSIVIALGMASLVGQAFELSFFVTNMITMIGLAVGIDYSLFVVARYREERAMGLDKMAAISRSGSTATRAVFFSGTTVVLALIGMLLVPASIFISLGIGAILVVIASVLASMTLLPAILSLLGDRINRLTIPLIGKTQQRLDETKPGGFWDWFSRGVMRQPVLSLLLAGGLLAAAAIPFFGINTGAAGVSSFPEGVKSRVGFEILNTHFSAGDVTPAEIVIDGDVDSPQVLASVDRLKEALRGDAAYGEPRPLAKNDARDLGLLSVPINGDAVSDEAQDAVRRLRDTYVPAAFSGVNATVLVTGETAFNMDFFQLAKDSAPVVFIFVLGVSFLLLMLVFRSILVPIKAILLNLLSVGATYGLLVLIFQKGVLTEVFGFQQADTIEAWIPLFLFSVLFGLSMDYHVFLLSRIRERYDQTGDNTKAVAFGIRSTGRLITGAALIMVSVFWAFSAGQLVGFQQMGFGLGTAVLLDATIVRMILVPAEMRLFGKWNWYLPKVLNWLPDLRVAPQAAPASEPVASGSKD